MQDRDDFFYDVCFPRYFKIEAVVIADGGLGISGGLDLSGIVVVWPALPGAEPPLCRCSLSTTSASRDFPEP